MLKKLVIPQWERVSDVWEWDHVMSLWMYWRDIGENLLSTPQDLHALKHKVCDPQRRDMYELRKSVWGKMVMSPNDVKNIASLQWETMNRYKKLPDYYQKGITQKHKEMLLYELWISNRVKWENEVVDLPEDIYGIHTLHTDIRLWIAEYLKEIMGIWIAEKLHAFNI